MALTIGQALLKARIINDQQLEEAIQAQVIFGGRIGTNLIELGHINITTLGRFLSRKYNVPTIDHSKLKPCPKDVIKMFGKKMALKYEAVPLALEGNRLDVLLSDPSNVAAIDEMGFTLGKRIKAYVAPEIIVMTLMEKYYGIPRDLRYVQLSLRDTQAMQHAKGQAANACPGVLDEHKVAIRPPIKSAPQEQIKGLEFGKNEELSSEEDFREMIEAYHTPASKTEPAKPMAAPPPPPPPPPLPPPPPPPPPPQAAEEAVMDLEEMVREPTSWEVQEPVKEEETVVDEEIEDLEVLEELPEALSLQEAAQRLKEVNDRDELSQVVLAFALSYFKRAALFITRGGMALGWDGMGGSVHRKGVQGIMMPLSAPSIFKTVHDSCSFFLGAVPKTALNERFLKLMGNERPASVFLIPILFHGQVVNILYGDNGDGQNAPTDISDLLILAPKVPQAFEDLILRRKRAAQTGA